MNNVIELETYLKRQKDIFDTFIQSHGKETSLIPFIKKFSQEDEQTYTYEDIHKYLSTYINSNLINAEELNLYTKAKLTTNDIIFKRGKLLVQRLIEAKGNFEDIMFYASIFAKEDGKIKPYDKRYLQKCRDYYLKNTKNHDKKDTYLKVIGLAKNSKNYTVDLLNHLLEIDDLNKAISFIRNINISQKSLNSLLATYSILYPTNKQEQERLKNIVDKAFNQTQIISFSSEKRRIVSPLIRIEELKKLIEDYLISDTERIEELFKKHKFNSYKFQEALKDAETCSDLILRNLLNKYYLKTASIKQTKKNIIESIVQAYENGVNYGFGYREFNKYDLYILAQNYSIESLLKDAYELYNANDYLKIESIFEHFKQSKIYNSSEALANSIGKFSKNGRTLSKDEILLITDYLVFAKLPLEADLFFATAMRYIDGDIKFEIIPDEESKIVNK